MFTTSDTTIAPANVLILSQGESSVRIETSTLRTLGISAISHCCSSAGALAFLDSLFTAPATLAENTTKKTLLDLIICDERFDNRLIFNFLLTIARNPLYANIPLLIVAGSNATLEAAKHCSISVIARPYTQKGLHNAITKALSLSCSPLTIAKLTTYCQGTKKTVKPATSPRGGILTTSDVMKRGHSRMHQRKYDEAEQEFLEVLRRQEDHLEANLALAKIYRARGNAPATNNFLLHAAATCHRKKEFKQAAAIRALLPEKMRHGGVFQQEALASLRIGDYKNAALGFLEHYAENPEQPLYAVIARACQMTRTPQECLTIICATYDQMGKKELAENLRRRLLADHGSAIPSPRSWLDKFPRLRDIVNVASYTAWIWKQA